MKKLLSIVGLLVLVFTMKTAEAQGTFIGVAPLGVLNKGKVKIEKALAPSISVGTFLAGYYGQFPGGMISPFFRVFPGSEHAAPVGFFIQMKLNGGLFDLDFDAVNPVIDEFVYGVGIGIGYQLQLDGSRIFFDFGGGVKVITYPRTDLDSLVWYITGPGSFWDSYAGLVFRLGKASS